MRDYDKEAGKAGQKPAAKQETAPRRSRRSGDRVQLSAFGDRDAAASLQGVDRQMPEKMRVRESPQGQHMQSVRPGTYTEYGKSPDKMVELETDTGRAEIGYDPKKMDTVVSFVQDDKTGRGRSVVENKSLTRRAMDGEKFRSNDRSFQSGAMSLRTDPQKSPKLVRRQLLRGGGGDSPTTMDRVIPFHARQGKEGQARRSLMQSRDSRGARPAGASKAVTAMQTIENRKASQAHEFSQKFDRAIHKTKLTHRSGDMYLILLRKKRLIMEALARGEPVPEGPLEAAGPDEPALMDGNRDIDRDESR